MTIPKAHLGGQTPSSAFSLVLMGAGGSVTVWVLICTPVLGIANVQTRSLLWRVEGGGWAGEVEGRRDGAGRARPPPLPVATVEPHYVTLICEMGGAPRLPGGVELKSRCVFFEGPHMF